MSKPLDKARASYQLVGCPGALDEDGWQPEQEYSIRCWYCMAVVGSIADPCRKAVDLLMEETRVDN